MMIIMLFITLFLLFLDLFVLYRINGSSMEDEFHSGDVILLHKSEYTVPKYLKLFSCNRFCRNEVMIFQRKKEISFLKRCAGMPGDTLDFRNNHFFVNGINYLKNSFVKAGYYIQDDSCRKSNFYSVVPYSGYEIALNDSTYNLYKDILVKYETDSIGKTMNAYYVNGIKCDNYKFRNNYYYFIGDNMANSLDSRSLGFIPEYFIKGKNFWHFRFKQSENK